jgi:hypothetical protein
MHSNPGRHRTFSGSPGGSAAAAAWREGHRSVEEGDIQIRVKIARRNQRIQISVGAKARPGGEGEPKRAGGAGGGEERDGASGDEQEREGKGSELMREGGREREGDREANARAGGGGVRGDGRRWRCRRERARVHAGMREERAARVGASRTCEGRFAAHDPAQPPAPAGGGGSGLAGRGARAPPAAAGAAAAGSPGGGDARPCAEGAVDPRSAAAAAWREGDRSGEDR